MSDLVGNPEDRFSRVAAHIISSIPRSSKPSASLLWLVLYPDMCITRCRSDVVMLYHKYGGLILSCYIRNCHVDK